MSAMHRPDAAPPSVQQIIGAIAGCEASADELREMIAAALADARNEGAVAMRDTIKHQAEINALYGVPAITLSTICALPLPEGSRQAEVLSDAEIQQARSAAVNNAPDDVLMGRVAGLGYAELHELSRAIEAAALEKNGMGVNRG